MRRYALGRILQAALALLGVTCVAFLLVSLSGDPAFILLPPEAGAEQRAAFRQLYGLDLPLPVQYARYVRTWRAAISARRSRSIARRSRSSSNASRRRSS